MSRIRSIHPGIWTDEQFVSLSSFARLLFIGIWNECDDKGIFPWSPLQMKMRVLPADNVDAAALMAELEATNCICRYEIDGKTYGAVRNFAKFQRPKYPNDIHPANDEVLVFAGHFLEKSPKATEPLPNHSPNASEKSPQMEDGGDKGREEIDCASGDALTPDDVLEGWNEIAQAKGLPVVRKLTEARKRQLKARLREWPDLQDWQAALRTIASTPFLCGDNPRGWRADFDFLLQPKSFTKLVEGAYGQAN